MEQKSELLFEFNQKFHQIPTYKEYNIHSTYIPMRDGVKIAIDICFPKGLSSNEKVSSVLLQTRYWRSAELRKPFKYFIKSLFKKDYIKAFISYGYAVLNVDVRGSGASFGYRISPWSEDEVKDAKEIIDWIIDQPWSDGNVFAFGNSYSGTTAELVAISNHQAVKGVAPMHNEIDPFLDISNPGGIFNDYFIKTWAHYNHCLDRNTSKGLGIIPRLFLKGVKSVESDKKKCMLKEAVKQHVKNLNVYEISKNLVFRDDTWEGKTTEYFSLYRYKSEIEQSNVPMYYWGSWMDAATSNVVIESFLTFRNPFIGVIGAWTHGAIWYASPYLTSKKEVIPNYKIQYEAIIRFFSASIKGIKPSEKIIYYYTIGEEKWKKTTSWPPLGQKRKFWYLSENNELTDSKSSEETGSDKYKIDFKATTGRKCNRWYTQLGGYPVIYTNRANEDKKLLTYNSLPLENNTEITGYPIITLFLSSTHEDGAIFVYLEDIDNYGKIYLLTEGQIRLIHRKISNEIPPYKTMIPYHTYKKKDSLPLIPGEVSEISFGLLPISVLIHKGHRIRIAIAGADKDTFVKIPKEGVPTITIERNRKFSSYINLPIIEK